MERVVVVVLVAIICAAAAKRETIGTFPAGELGETSSMMYFDVFERVPIAESSVKQYDFVIDIESVEAIKPGWPIRFYSNHTLTHLLPEAPKNAPVVGLLGYYSKGKSFVVNGIYNAGGEAVQESFLGYKSTVGSVSVATGAGVTTKGISGVFVANRSILLDTAGRNAPASRPADLGELGLMRSYISSIRSKERLIDDIILGMANTIIYVVDELLNEDQRTIVHMIEHLSATQSTQKLVILHNWKRMDCNNATAVNEHIAAQLVSAFDAKEKDRSPADVVSYGIEARSWVSTWKLSRQSTRLVHVTHMILYDNNKCEAINKKMFMRLENEISQTVNSNERTSNIIASIAAEAKSNLHRYVKDAPREANAEPPENDDSEATSNGSGTVDEVNARISVSGKAPLQLLGWELREMPSATSDGDYVPRSSAFARGDVYFIRVDLPGFDAAMKLTKANGTRTPGKDVNWYRVDQVHDTLFASTKSVIISGNRVAVEGDTSRDSYGTFRLTFKVPVLFSGNSKVSIVNGCLSISLEALLQSEL